MQPEGENEKEKERQGELLNDCQVECIESAEESMRRMCLQLILMAKYAEKYIKHIAL